MPEYSRRTWSGVLLGIEAASRKQHLMFHRRFLLFLSVLLIGLTAKVVWSLVVTGSARPPCPDCITLPGKSPICPVPTSIIEREGATLDENVAGDVAGDFEPNIEPSLQPTPTATPDDDSAMVEPLIPPIQLTGSSTGDGVDDGPTFDHDWQAVFHPHGSQTCASGCATSRHPTAELDDSQFLQLMQQYVERPPYAASLALDSLLYFGRQTRRKLHGP